MMNQEWVYGEESAKRFLIERFKKTMETEPEGSKVYEYAKAALPKWEKALAKRELKKMTSGYGG